MQQIAIARLSVDGQVEQRHVADAIIELQSASDRLYALRLHHTTLADDSALFQIGRIGPIIGAFGMVMEFPAVDLFQRNADAGSASQSTE